MTETQKEPWFSRTLLRWHRDSNTRVLPWKGEKDAYRIWLSEIILQQTRAEQGGSYYEKFIRAYPGVGDLAAADDQEVFKLWEGLGYYARCRNLLITARRIAWEMDGKFPDTRKELETLKGIGPYTAAAIASFAFNRAEAVVDGNVVRVLARVFGMLEPVDEPANRKKLDQKAGSLISAGSPAEYNQAIMDFGATVCKPLAPNCGKCPFQNKCKAYSRNLVQSIPRKKPKPSRRTRWFYYLVCEYEGQVLIRERKGKDIWRHLHEFVLWEDREDLDMDRMLDKMALKKQLSLPARPAVVPSPLYRQLLTHQEVRGRFLHLRLHHRPDAFNDYHWVPAGDLQKLPFPRMILSYLKENRYIR